MTSKLLPACAMIAVLFAGCATPDSGGGKPTQDETPPAAGGPGHAAAPTAAPLEPVRPYPGITVYPERQRVEIGGRACLDAGWLEQIACGPHTREHESLVVIDTAPSLIHASLLLAGFEPGAPGRWSYENDTYAFVPPTGSALRISVRWQDASGKTKVVPVRTWIRAHDRSVPFPDEPWIFGGSEWRTDDEGREHYAADLGGSIIGLVTFGDEVIGFSRVIADQADVQAPEWMVDEAQVPPPGTPVTVIVEPW